MSGLTYDWYGFANDVRLLDVQRSSFRNRRQSNIEFDAIHEVPADGTAAPAQLYTTESGRLFHSGKIAIVTVGLPARGKTYAFRWWSCIDLLLILSAA
jgi:hypothetical protein